MKIGKKILSVFLATLVLVGCVPFVVFATNNDSFGVENGNVEFASNSTFGSMLSDAIEEETNISSEYSVSAIEFNSNEATVTYSAVKDCTLLVGIYDEETDEMFAYSSKEVYYFEEIATVSFSEYDLPEYFVAKAYLVTDTGAALCKNYVSYTYTKAFKENFRDVTVNDFEEEKVVNLDEDETTNFAVISDTTKKIVSNGVTNVLESADENGDKYVFSNVDFEISSLKPGDVFWYYTGDESEVIIIKVKDISINYKTAIITSDQTSLDEVFDYVKIEESNDEYEMNFTPYYDESDENHDVQTYNTRTLERARIDVGDSASVSVTYPFGKNGEGWNINENVKVTGSITLKVGATVRVYYKSHMLRDNYLQVEASISPELKISASVSAEMKDKAIKKIGEVTIAPCPGLYIKFTPSFVVKASAKITLSGTLTAKAGFEYNNIEGFVNKSERPNFKPEIKVEGEFFIGVDMTPHVAIIHEKVADAGITAEAGIIIKAATDEKSDTHMCYICLDGDIDFSIKISAYVKFVNKFKPEAELVDFTAKLFDFYYSADHFEFGWSTCPYKKKDVPVEYNGHYYFVFDKSKTWTEAKTYCESIGGHLVTITTADEQKFITDKMLKVGFKNCYWIGAYKQNNEFKWVTGEDFNYTNWKSGEPNNQGNRENYLEIFRATYNDISVGQWNDIMHDGRNGELDKDFYSLETTGLICEWENYKDYKDHASEIREEQSTYNLLPTKRTLLVNNNSSLNDISATILERDIIFKAEQQNVYMLYSVDENQNIKYISQGIANESGIVKTLFFKAVDTETYVVGDFGEGIISLLMSISDHVHTYSKHTTAPTCTEAGIITYTCTCNDTYTEEIAATGHTFGDKDANCKDCGFDRTEGCGCNCHKGGIAGFFFKIILFFQKLFRTNQVCTCGINHY